MQTWIARSLPNAFGSETRFKFSIESLKLLSSTKKKKHFRDTQLELILVFYQSNETLMVFLILVLVSRIQRPSQMVPRN